MYGKQSSSAALFNAVEDNLSRSHLGCGLLCDLSDSRPTALPTDLHYTTAHQSVAGSHSHHILQMYIVHNNNNNNNMSICKVHNVSIRAESEAPAVARWRGWLEG